MKKANRKIQKFIPTLFIIIILALMYSLNYIDKGVIVSIYLPIWLVGTGASLLGKNIFGNMIIIFSGIGLVAEYLIHIAKPFPNMSGAFLNTLILLLGVVLGVVLQFKNGRKFKGHR